MNWKPNRWGATTLSFLAPPLGMLYITRPRLAGVYLLVLLVAALTQFWLIGNGHKIPLTVFLAVIAATHSYRIAVRAPEVNSRPWYSRWYGLLSIAMSSFMVLAFLRAFFFEPFHLPSQSMFPSMPAGSYIVVQKYGYGNYASYGIRMYRGAVVAPLNRGQVLVFEYPRDHSIRYVMRLVGLPGDRLEYKGKRLFVNGEPLPTKSLGLYQEFEITRESTYNIATQSAAPRQDFDAIVKPGHLFFLGDNRDNANDSRYWGQVPEANVVGNVVLVLKNPEAQHIIPPDLAHEAAQRP
ncbi:MAG: signal peptidase I [Propionivibrio sp.]|uniref:signal peptidase I n=1 Tax=Propionivibrio sp. TaxID=2212460 RepID=UPI001A646376|nr:signal peptidase I [Propionivibrio sp.]MBL8415192.1 signal peptidase I [Propionivibrio sp.]